MSGWQNEQTEGLCEALLALRSKGECYAFLEDVCTIKEILDISQRLAVAKLLDKVPAPLQSAESAVVMSMAAEGIEP